MSVSMLLNYVQILEDNISRLRRNRRNSPPEERKGFTRDIRWQQEQLRRVKERLALVRREPIRFIEEQVSHDPVV
jgi:DNA repair exonuclease SbcCD ATPase subunit